MIYLPVYTLRGIDVATSTLRRRMKKLSDWREPLLLIAQDFYKLEEGWLDSEGRGSWPALSPRYAKWKENKVGPLPILQFSGAMYSDLIGQSAGSMVIRRDRLTLRTPQSKNRWKLHAEGQGKRKVRNPLSPALRVRHGVWASLMTKWAAGK
jgi:hypothetical protein